MRVLRVVAAVIWREGADGREVFATQRGYGDMKGGWEFPGGKMIGIILSVNSFLRERG